MIKNHGCGSLFGYSIDFTAAFRYKPGFRRPHTGSARLQNRMHQMLKILQDPSGLLDYPIVRQVSWK